MWKHEEKNQYDTINLHDCRMNQIENRMSDVIFSFADGFWITEANKHNPFKGMFRTDDKAKLTFTNISGLKIMLDGKDFTWDEFCQKINSGQWEFECIDEKYESSQCLYEGWVWFDREPYHQELLMSFSYGDAVYQWDTIREDRPW